MPLTVFQQEVLRLLARFRSPESYLAGGVVVNQTAGTPRFSDDLDIFHDAEAVVARSAEVDVQTLTQNGFEVVWDLRRPAFYRARASRSGQSVRLDWAIDSAFRFFPIEADAELGYRLHLTDVAMNKVLALAGRSEARDFVDVLHLHRTHLSLGAIAWAACAKDPGFTPELLLQEMGRNANFQPAEFQALALAQPWDPGAAKITWLQAVEEARALFDLLPAGDLGCLYLKEGKPVTPQDRAEVARLLRHRGSLRGAWPVISGDR
ncbi:MAG: nucleotidyl transferase AbiEii/AbiGii toxin family protein [Verrucomicrobiota bacterium]|nr:nucleotidyl transferase AbiEii/AbiGii toxin family protein [Chthoniobacterales bacterium]MDQ3413727.1 nucleotidyl transferase AbiEii/AbiGii toxin family protein [Verrucomicrobiota bacterium]